MTQQDQEFLNGWTAAESDEANGKGERKSFPSYRTGAFIEGYTAFFDKQRLEIEQAECECETDYDDARDAALDSQGYSF